MKLDKLSSEYKNIVLNKYIKCTFIFMHQKNKTYYIHLAWCKLK